MFALTVGLAIYLHQVESLRSLVYLVLALLCLMCLIGMLLLPELNRADEARYRASCLNRLRQIGLALQNYHQVNGCFPPAYIADRNGKPIHSWRVLILPYMEYDALYKQCDLTQPWDAPKNKKLLAYHFREFVCPNDTSADAPSATQTSYVAVVGPSAAWAGEKSRKLADFGNDAANTIMLVEVVNSGIDWAEPRDLSLDSLGVVDANSFAPALSSNHRPREEFFFTYDYGDVVCVAMADGSVNVLRTDGRSSEELRKILQIGGYKEERIRSREDSYVWKRRLNWPNIAALAVWLISVGTLLTLAVRSRKVVPTSPAC
ncbi:MAG: DUF1559 domain-containing protein [Thermoguttaceae bacterium]